MLNRLGKVFYTLSLIVGLPLVALMLWGLSTESISPSGHAVLIVTSGAIILTGRGLRYVLSGY